MLRFDDAIKLLKLVSPLLLLIVMLVPATAWYFGCNGPHSECTAKEQTEKNQLRLANIEKCFQQANKLTIVYQTLQSQLAKLKQLDETEELQRNLSGKEPLDEQVPKSTSTQSNKTKMWTNTLLENQKIEDAVLKAVENCITSEGKETEK